MKKSTILLLLSVIVLISLILSGCDAGLSIEDIKIVKYPDRIVYIAGVDDNIDLTGGQYSLILSQTKEGDTGIVSDMADIDEDIHLYISHQIDFKTPGIYPVRIYIYNGNYVEFPIQVIDKNDLLLYT